MTVIGNREHGTGGWSLSVAAGPTFRPAPSWSVSVRPTFNRTVDEQQYVATRSGSWGEHYILGKVDQRVFAIVSRLNVTFSPDLTLELFAQPFVSSVGFVDFKRVGEAASANTERRWSPYAGEELRVVEESASRTVWGYFDQPGDETPAYTFGDPGFDLRSLRGNALLRWEYRPGSALYLVWQQSRRAHGFGQGFDPVGGLRDLARGSGDHVLLLRASYWIGR